MTTEAKQLFDKPMDELREAFVRNRLSEPAIFGLAEIETWLKWQRTQERPDETRWSEFLAREFLAMCAATAPITHLRERATPYATLPGEQVILGIFPHRSGAEHLLRVLHMSSPVEGMYYGHKRGCIAITILEDGETRSLLLLREGMDGQLMSEHGHSNLPGTARLVIDALFAEWERQRPKWREAREFLCNALAEEVKRERAKAEADFDSAVAVSADGTKIVLADWVVIAESTSWTEAKVTIFPASAFKGRTILRSPKVERTSERATLVMPKRGFADDAERIVHTLRHTSIPLSTRWSLGMELSPGDHDVKGSLQRFVECHIDHEFCYLLTTRDFCPSPLPDGGVEVKV